MTTTLGLALALVPLLALRALAVAAEAMIASEPGLRRSSVPSEAVLASTAQAVGAVTGAASIGVLVMLVAAHAPLGIVPLVLAIAVPVLLVVADLVPRGLAAGVPLPSRRLAALLLGAGALVLAPLLLVERVLTVLLLGRRGVQSVPLIALRRFGGWFAARPGRSPLDVSESGLVARIARFAAKTAHDALVPLVDVCAVPDTASIGEMIALVRERGFSRLPVFHERIFNVIGIASSLDVLGVGDVDRPVTGVMHGPLFVPESKPLPELLATLRAEGWNLAVVVDEYGGAVGLVTVEDLVEEIVGEIEDEYDLPREFYRRVAPGVFVLNARAPVAEVNERFAWNLPQGEYETVGGLVLERLGRVPRPGDGVRVGRVRIEVTRASSRAIQEVCVRETGRVRS